MIFKTFLPVIFSVIFPHKTYGTNVTSPAMSPGSMRNPIARSGARPGIDYLQMIIFVLIDVRDKAMRAIP